MENKIPTREEREEPQHEEDCCCGTCEARPFLAKIAALEKRLAQLQRTVEFNEREYLSAHGGSWGVCKYQALNQALEQRLAAANSALSAECELMQEVERALDSVMTETERNGGPIGSGVIPAITRLLQRLAAAEAALKENEEQESVNWQQKAGHLEMERDAALLKLAAAEADLEDYRKRYYAVQDRITAAEADTARALQLAQEMRGFVTSYRLNDQGPESQWWQWKQCCAAIDAARKEGKP